MKSSSAEQVGDQQQQQQQQQPPPLQQKQQPQPLQQQPQRHQQTKQQPHQQQQTQQSSVPEGDASVASQSVASRRRKAQTSSRAGEAAGLPEDVSSPRSPVAKFMLSLLRHHMLRQWMQKLPSFMQPVLPHGRTRVTTTAAAAAEGTVASSGVTRRRVLVTTIFVLTISQLLFGWLPWPGRSRGVALFSGSSRSRGRLGGEDDVSADEVYFEQLVPPGENVSVVWVHPRPQRVSLLQTNSSEQTDKRGTKKVEEDDDEPLVAVDTVVNGYSLVSASRLWQKPPNQGFHPCDQPSKEYIESTRNWTRGYLTVHANGGLNQMRAGICDMVAVARIINATLVIPELDKSSFWNDSSTFSDIFDEKHFIAALRRDVPVVRRLPRELKYAPVKRLNLHSWSDANYYSKKVGKFWKQFKVIRALKSDARLANSWLPPDIQRLRCRVHFGGILRFAPQIEAFGEELVRRMRSHGPFIALHLRYEADMLAFTGCTHGLTHDETKQLTKMRMGAKQWRVKEINAEEQRAKGLCPLTPYEVGLFLSALGFPNKTRIYIAAGEIFGGDERMKDLRQFFPNLERKETLATAEELAPLAAHPNAMAALDSIVAVASDVFVASYSGNMAKAVEGHRRYLGHRKTITPDRKGLARLFDELQRGEVRLGPTFSERVALLHMHRQGAPRRRRAVPKGTRTKEILRNEESLYSNPLPDCLCRDGVLDDERERKGKAVAVHRRLKQSSV